MSVDWSPLQKASSSALRELQGLFTEHHFLTIVCAFFAVLMTVSFYRFLRGINPALVGFVLLLVLSILVMHWTQTRTEPAFLKPLIDGLAPFLPSAPAAVAPV